MKTWLPWLKWLPALFVGVLGVGACVVVLLPDLVIFGLYLLVLPGLVLGILPTLFLWVAPVTLSWTLLHGRLGHVAPVVLAIVVQGALYTLPPGPGQRAAQEALAAHHRDDVVPVEPIVVRGDVRIDVRRPKWDQDPANRLPGNIRPFACDDRCGAILFRPGVTSVTVNRSVTVPIEQGRPALAPLNPSSRTYFLERGAEVQIWGEPPIERFDVVVVDADFQAGAAEGKRFVPTWSWSLGATAPHVRYVEMRGEDGTTLALHQRVSVQGPRRPLWVGFEGNGPGDYRFGWARRTYDDGDDDRRTPWTLDTALERWTR